MRRWRTWIGAILLATLVATASAAAPQPYINLTSDAARDAGRVTLTAIGSTSLRNLRFGDVSDGTFVPLGAIDALPYFETDPVWGDIGIHTLDRVARWRCDRLDRTFMVVGTAPDGTDVSATYDNRTPSCARRFVLDGPLRARRGTRVVVDVRDTFDLGDTGAQFCVVPPRRDPACFDVGFGPEQSVASGAFRATRRGRWRVVVRTGEQTLRRTVSVGVRPRPRDRARLPTLLTTGDSLMQGPEALLRDRLQGRRATVASDIRLGSGLTRPFIVDWARIPAEQVRRYDPDAVVLFLGGNDESPITAPGGTEVQCCGPDWTAQYARLARDVMTTYTASGASVYWFNVPTLRDPRRRANQVAVNAALIQAAAGLPRTEVIDIDAVLTPGGVYRDTMRVGGRDVRVRQADGVHLTVAGARVANRLLLRRLAAGGVLAAGRG